MNITLTEGCELLKRLRESGKGEELEAAGFEPRDVCVGIAPPTAYCAAKISSFFEGDDDVFTSFNYDKGELAIMVKGFKKADAINMLVKRKHEFGGREMTVKVIVVPENGEWEILDDPGCETCAKGTYELIQTIMKGNKFNGRFYEVTDPVFQKTYYLVEFAPIVCRFKVDNLANLHGWGAALAQDVFDYAFKGADKVFISTMCD